MRFSLRCRTLLWLALVVGAVLVDVGVPSLARAESDRPNFIVIIADDVGWNDLGCYGHETIRTPNLDRMAVEGIRFETAWLTCSSCSPSRCSIMTGRYPHSTGAAELHMPLPADQIVFAGLLKDAGYYTASAGKWHLGEAAKKNFDLIVGGSPSGCEKWVQTLRDRPRDKPFFCWFASFDAHRGYQKNAIPKPHQESDAVVPPFLPDNEATRGDLAMYYDEITRLDDYTGKVLAELDSQGVRDNTLILFLSDNGRPFPRCKTTLYDSGVRTPLIAYWPKRIKPASSGSLVSSVDIAPTILQLAGLEPGPSFQGKSFVSVLQDPRQQARRYAFAEHNWHDYQAHERAVRSERFIYIRNAFPELPGTPPADAVRSPTYESMQKLHAVGELSPEQRGCFEKPRPAEELYDVRNDPHCLTNLAGKSTHAETLKQMRGVLDRWIERTGDSVPDNPTPDWFDRTTGKRIPGVQGRRGDQAGA